MTDAISIKTNGERGIAPRQTHPSTDRPQTRQCPRSRTPTRRGSDSDSPSPVLHRGTGVEDICKEISCKSEWELNQGNSIAPSRLRRDCLDAL